MTETEAPVAETQAAEAGETTEATAQPSQTEMPFAIVQGEAVTELPQDLYIPPDALEVILEAFEGPLDLLLYLIRRQNIDILDIPIADITRQYVSYIDLMTTLHLELAAEYLVMAAMLAEIKSRLLLPRPVVEDDESGPDPRAELVRRLQEYERYKKAAENIEELPRLERDVFPASAEMFERKSTQVLPEITLKELLTSFQDVLRRADMFSHHHVQREPLSVRQRMSDVLGRLKPNRSYDFAGFFIVTEGRMGVVVTFMAVLELIKESLIELEQEQPYAPISIRVASHNAAQTSNADDDGVPESE